MSITKEKNITVDGRTFSVNAEIYNSTKYVIEDANSRSVKISDYKLSDVHRDWHPYSLLHIIPVLETPGQGSDASPHYYHSLSPHQKSP